MATLQLSQQLLIDNIVSISYGETDSYFADCNEYGKTNWLPFSDRYLPLTEKAQAIWKGDKKVEKGLLKGRVFVSKVAVAV